MKLKNITTRKIEKKWNSKLLEEYIKRKEKYQKEVTERLAEHREEKSIEDEWKKIKQTINTAARNKIRIKKIDTKK